MRSLVHFVRSDLFISMAVGFVVATSAIIATNPAFAATVFS